MSLRMPAWIKGRNRKRSFEPLERRCLLAIDIVWTNEFTDDGSSFVPQFDDYYQQNEQIAREIVNRAIVDWEQVINSFNDANNPSDTFNLTVRASGPGDVDEILGRGAAGTTFVNGKPVSGEIILDNNGGDSGWFFDQTPLDDVEFTGIAGTFQASFVDASTVGQQRQNDFYRTIAHEIGHTLGFRLAGAIAATSSNSFGGLLGLNSGQAIPPSVGINTPGGVETLPSARYDAVALYSKVSATLAAEQDDANLGTLNFVGVDQVSPVRLNPNISLVGAPSNDPVFVVNELWRYDFQDGSGRSVTFTEDGGGHLYEGPLNANTPGATAHPNELLNAGRTIPAGTNPVETTRKFISDLAVSFLADAYGYSVTLPSTLNNAHVTLDPQTGILLVQGRPRTSAGAGQNEAIDIALSGSDLVVTVTYNSNSFVERVPAAQVRDIVIHQNAGADSVNIGTGVATSSRAVIYVDHVVSSNTDAVETSTSVGGNVANNGIVDLDPIVPGNQTTLRAAIVEANATTGAQAIYVGRGHYQLTRTHSGTDNALTGDLDINSTVTLIGAGAGATVIDAGGSGGLGDRVFEVKENGIFDARQLTISGGHTTGDGGGILLSAVDPSGISNPSSASASLFEVAVVDNKAAHFAGGIAGYDVALTITNSVIANNEVTSLNWPWYSGGVNVGNNGTFVLTGSVLAGNTAALPSPGKLPGLALAFLQSAKLPAPNALKLFPLFFRM